MLRAQIVFCKRVNVKLRKLIVGILTTKLKQNQSVFKEGVSSYVNHIAVKFLLRTEHSPGL